MPQRSKRCGPGRGPSVATAGSSRPATALTMRGVQLACVASSVASQTQWARGCHACGWARNYLSSAVNFSRYVGLHPLVPVHTPLQAFELHSPRTLLCGGRFKISCSVMVLTQSCLIGLCLWM